MFNNDADYARSRIVASYMKGKEKHDGLYKIVEIQAKGNDLKTAKILAYDSKNRQVGLTIDMLCFSPGKLGYINDWFSGTATFLSRLPIRRDFRQGLRASQLCSLRNGSSNSISDNWLETNIQSVSSCLCDTYSSLAQVIEKVEEANVDMAFSKNFALSNKYKLLYKGFVIGDLKKDDTFKIQTAFSFVEEEFAKEVGNDKLSR
jgi:hypothetical protein